MGNTISDVNRTSTYSLPVSNMSIPQFIEKSTLKTKIKKVGLQKLQVVTNVTLPSVTTDAYVYSIAHFLNGVKRF